jgi:hypothetical protein
VVGGRSKSSAVGLHVFHLHNFWARPQSRNRDFQLFSSSNDPAPSTRPRPSVFNAALSSAIFHRMHAAAFNALRAAHRPISRAACRIVAGSRCSLPRRSRNFHRSAVAYRIPDGTPVPTNTENASPQSSELDESKADEETTETTENSAEADNAPAPIRRNGKTVSGRARGNRSRQPEGVPPFILPESFLESNVMLAGDLMKESLAIVKGKEAISGADDPELKISVETENQSAEELDSGPSPTPKYGINSDIYTEICATLRAGLALRPPKNSNSNLIPRPISKIYFLNVLTSIWDH